MNADARHREHISWFATSSNLRARKIVEICALILWIACALSSAACRTPSQQISSATRPETPTPYETGDDFADLLERERDREVALALEKARIDARGITNDCAALASPDALATIGPRTSWLQVWCALRTQQWQALLDRSSRAIAYFEVSGELRRLIEVHLAGALAAHQLQQLDERDRHLERAELLLHASDQPLTGSLHDHSGGDLPYLLARLMHLDVDIDFPLSRKTPDPRRLLELARFEYASSSMHHAIPHTWRAQATSSLDRGELVDAASSLAAAIEQDRANASKGGMIEDLILFSSLARVSGADDWADASIDWLFVNDRGDLILEQIANEVIPETREQLAHLAAHQQGRLRMIRAVRGIRRNPKTALHPPEAMLALFRQTKDLSILRGSSWELAGEVGLMFAELGEHQHARRYLEHAIAQVEAMRRSIPDLQQRQRFFQDKRDLYMALVHGYVGIDTARLTQEDYRAALDLSAMIKARGMLDLLDGHTFAHLGPKQRSRASLHKLADLPLERAVGEVSVWLARWDGEGNAKEVNAARAPTKLALPKDTLLLEFLLTERSGYVWVVTADGTISMRRIAGRRHLAPLLADFRETLVDHDYDKADFIRHRELAERLYVELIGPVQDLIVGADRIYLAPDDILHELAFEALARPSTDRIPDYLVRSHTLQYVPSSRVLARLQQREKSPSERALLLGAPTLEQSAIKMLSMARQIPAEGVLKLSSLFPELPGSARELSNISRALKRKGILFNQHTGSEATETILREAGQGQHYKLVHIAAHGVSDAPRWRDGQPEISVEQPALLLARDENAPDDGIWRLDEILSHGVSARLVILSGCTTGRGWRTLGDGAYGLSGAFLSNGSQAVMASLWSVSDKATTALMTRVYDRLDADADDAARALRRAQLDIMKLKSRSGSYMPPFYWAAFRVIGI